MAHEKATAVQNRTQTRCCRPTQLSTWQSLLTLIWLLGPCFANAQNTVTLDTAVVTIQYQNHSQAQKAITLPYDLNLAEPGKSGNATFEFKPIDNRAGLIDSIYIPHIGNRHAITLNGHDLEANLIEESGDTAYASGPRFLRIPPSLQTDSLRMVITLSAEQTTNPGLSRVTLGQASELRSAYQARKFWVIDSCWIAVTIGALLALFSLALWTKQREVGVLYYCISEIAWTILSARTILTDPPFNSTLWQTLTFVAPVFIGSACLCLYLHSLQPSDPPSKMAKGRYMMPIAAASVILCSLDSNKYLMGILLLPTAASLVRLAYLNARAIAKSKDRNCIHVLITFVVAMMLVSIETTVFTLSWNAYEQINLLRLVWFFLGISFAKSMLDRIAHANLMLNTVAQILRQPMPQQPTELAEAFAASTRQYLMAGAAEERLRLIHDLHDGVGNQLSSTLDIAQQQGANASDMVPHLRKTLEQLKLTVDALEESDGNLESIIASVRYRLAPRIEALGVQLRWHVDPLPTFERWTSQHALHLQMLLLEAFDNSIKYAKNHHIEFTASPFCEHEKTGITLVLRDAGPGFIWPPVENKSRCGQGKGMGIMLYRAEKINAHLDIQSNLHGTTLTLRLLKI